MSDSQSSDSRVTAWSLLEPFWNANTVNIYEGPEVFLAGFKQVPRPIRNLLAVWLCDAEIRNGGFHQFFSNSTGVLAPEGVTGLRAIGLNDCAELLESAMKLFGDPYPRDRNERTDRLEGLERPGEHRKEWDPFYDLDNRYYKERERVAFEERLDEFAGKHCPRALRGGSEY